MSIGNFVGDIDLFSNPIEEEEAEEEYRRKLKEAAEKAKKAAEEQKKRQEEAAKKAQEAQKAPERIKTPEKPKPPERPKPPEPIERPEPPKPPEEVNRQEARDRQRLEQQTPETQAAFESKYGARAKEEWVREHEQELDRNLGVYGQEEPKAGTRALPGQQAPDAPDRTIGRYTYDPNAPAGEARRPPGSVPNPNANIPGAAQPGLPQNPMVTATTPQAPTSLAPIGLPAAAEAARSVWNSEIGRLVPSDGQSPGGWGALNPKPAVIPYGTAATQTTDAGGAPRVMTPSSSAAPAASAPVSPVGLGAAAEATRNVWNSETGRLTQPPAQEQQAPIPADAPPRPTDPGDYVLVQSPNGVKAWVTRDVWSNGSYTDPGTGAQRPYGEVLQVIYDPDKELRPVQMPTLEAQPGALQPVPMPQLGEPGAGERLDPGFNKPPFITPLPAPAAGTTDPAITSATGVQAPTVLDSGMKIPGQPAQALPANAPPMPLLGDSILVGEPGQEPYWYSRSGYEDAKNAARIEGIPVPPIIYDPKAAGASSVTTPTAPTTAAPAAPAAPTVAPVTAQPGTAQAIQNPDGSVTTERSITITDPRLNGGKPTNIPTVWNGVIVDDDTAVENATRSGTWPAFNTIDEAVAAAQQRSNELGTGQTTSVGGAVVPTPAANAIPADAPPKPPRDVLLVQTENGTKMWLDRSIYETGTMGTGGPPMKSLYQVVHDPLAPQAAIPGGGSQTALMSSRSTSPTDAQPSNIRLMSSPSGTPTPTAPTPASPAGAFQPPTALTAPGTPAGALLSAQQNPYLGAFSTTKPVETVLQLTNKNPQDAVHILGGISALVGGKLDAEGKAVGAWAEPYLNDIARLAWAREEVTNGRNSDPRNAPLDYIETWKDGYFGGDVKVPLVKEMNQQMIDYGVQKATQEKRPFDWRDVYGQNGEAGLVVNQKTAVDCGPNAISTVARSMGYNMTPEQAFEYAKEKKYHTQGRFNGPWAYADMLKNELGVQATTADLQWKTVDAELDAGRVVTLSGPSHYWMVTGKRQGPNGTEYYGGATNTAVYNPAWASPGQLRWDGSGPTHMITTAPGATVDPNSAMVKRYNLPPPTPGAAAAPNPNNRSLLSAMTTRQRAEHIIGTQARADAAHHPQDLGSQPPSQAPAQAPSPNMSAQSKPPRDPRITAAATENLWSNNQTNRHALMVEQFNRPMAEKQAEFDAAIERGLDEEGITDPGTRQQWRNSMTMMATGKGLAAGRQGENPNLNPYMIAGEYTGRPGTAHASPGGGSSALGYFQFLRQKKDGSLYGHEQYLPDEYKDNPFDPTGQVRQYIRAITRGGHKGDIMGPIREKNNTGIWGP